MKPRLLLILFLALVWACSPRLQPSAELSLSSPPKEDHLVFQVNGNRGLWLLQDESKVKETQVSFDLPYWPYAAPGNYRDTILLSLHNSKGKAVLIEKGLFYPANDDAGEGQPFPAWLGFFPDSQRFTIPGKATLRFSINLRGKPDQVADKLILLGDPADKEALQIRLSFQTYYQDWDFDEHWRRASTENTKAAYQAFFQYAPKHPNDQGFDSNFGETPDATMGEAFEKAATLQSRTFYESYLEQYPQGDYAAKAREALVNLDDEDAWREARYQDTRDAYLNYLEKHPNGRYARQAEEKLPVQESSNDEEQADLEAWDLAKQQNTREAYQYYLNQFPQGRFASEARDALLRSEETNLGSNTGNDEPSANGGDRSEKSEGEPVDTAILIRVSPEELNDFILGQVAYELPDSMWVGTWSKVVLIVSKNRDTTQLKQEVIDRIGRSTSLEVPKPQPQAVTGVRLSPKMRATLSSKEADAFQIDNSSAPAEQSVDLVGDGATFWVWDIKPLRAGKLPLKLTLAIKEIDESFGETTRIIDVFERRVRVVTIEKPEDTRNFSLLWLVGGGLLLLAAFLLWWVLGRKKKSSSVPGAEAPLTPPAGPYPQQATWLIKQGALEQALELLDQELPADASEARQQLIMHQANLASNNRSRDLDLLPPAEIRRTRNQITQAMLALIEDLD